MFVRRFGRGGASSGVRSGGEEESVAEECGVCAFFFEAEGSFGCDGGIYLRVNSVAV